MQLERHLAQVQDHLRAAAALGDEHTKDVANALGAAAAPAVRLALLGALSEAADEISTALLDYPGSPVVTVRLDGDAVDVEVRAAEQTEPEQPRPEDGELNARISLRLSESLKSDIDDAAEAEGVSVNTWLVRVASAAARGSGQLGPGFGAPSGRGRQRHGQHQRITGWINT